MKGDGEDTATTEMKAQSLGTALRTRQQTKNGNSHTVTCKGVNIAFLLWYYHAGTA